MARGHLCAANLNPYGTSDDTHSLKSLQLANGGMFLAYYSKKLMLHSPEARTAVVLPDKAPLPSLVSNVTPRAGSQEKASRVKPVTETDQTEPSTGARPGKILPCCATGDMLDLLDVDHCSDACRAFTEHRMGCCLVDWRLGWTWASLSCM
jgi:hypothetical protein